MSRIAKPKAQALLTVWDDAFWDDVVGYRGFTSMFVLSLFQLVINNKANIFDLPMYEINKPVIDVDSLKYNVAKFNDSIHSASLSPGNVFHKLH